MASAMHALTRAIHIRLVTDHEVTSRVKTYRNEPGLFSGRAIPTDASPPYIHIRPSTEMPAWDTLRRRGYRITRDLAIYAGDPGSDKELDDLSLAVRNALHDAPLAVEGHAVAMCKASGPVDLPEEQGYSARLVTVTVWLLEN